MLEKELIQTMPKLVDAQDRVHLRKALVFSRRLVRALRAGFDREPDRGRAKILSTNRPAIRYREEDVKTFLQGLRKHVRQ